LLNKEQGLNVDYTTESVDYCNNRNAEFSYIQPSGTSITFAV